MASICSVTELSAYARSYPPAYDQPRNDLAALLDDGKHDDGRKERLGSKSNQAISRLQR